MNGDSFMFTALRDEGDDPLSVTLPALVAPLSAPLWVGERRQFSPTPQEYKLLASLLDENGSAATSFLYLGAQRGELVGAPSAAIAGALGCEARLLSLSMISATILGIGRLDVASAVAERPFRIVRGRRVTDDEDEDAQAAADQARARALELWEGAAGSAKRIQAARFKSRLKMLGGAASAALLAIPMEDQLELSAKAASGDSDGASAARAAARSKRPPSLEEWLESGATLQEEMTRAKEAVGDGVGTVELESHVALRLCSGSEEAQHQAAFKARAPVARWNRAIELLEATRLRLAAVESMTSAVADDDDGEDPA